MIKRRDFLKAYGCLTAALILQPSVSDAGSQQPESLPAGIGVNPDYPGPLPKTGSLGDRPPTGKEEKIAKAVLAKAPTGPIPYDVASYFLAIAKGQYGETWQPYAQGWPVRWNPVIVNFFQATGTEPSGDLTSWCAAFANWCFQQSGKGRATRSASSGSFRSFGKQTSTPEKGDLVVFRRTKPDTPDDMRGHVGFFVADFGTEVEVLGGNQIEGHEQCHIVSSKRLLKNGKVLTLHSFRTDPRLHSA